MLVLIPDGLPDLVTEHVFGVPNVSLRYQVEVVGADLLDDEDTFLDSLESFVAAVLVATEETLVVDEVAEPLCLTLDEGVPLVETEIDQLVRRGILPRHQTELEGKLLGECILIHLLIDQKVN